MTDQQRGATVLPGHRLRARTPRLDALAADGITFSRAYTVSPHCCPSRASFFTGLYPSEHGVWNNVNVPNALSRGPRDGTPFWSTALSDAGYRLGFAGKWHVSNTTNPRDYGWQECQITGAGSGRSDLTDDQQRAVALEQDHRTLEQAARVEAAPRRPGEIIRPGYVDYQHYGVNSDPFNDRAVVDSAVDFIHDQSDHTDPWMTYVGTLGPHDPYQPPAEFLDLYDLDDILLEESFADPMLDKPALYRRIRDRFDQLTEAEHREALRHYLAFCSYEDMLFGRVYDAVEESGQLDNTIFVYLSDHGDYAGDHGLWCKGLPAFDSAYHVPLIVAGRPLTAEVQGSLNDTMISMVDLGPTLLDLCGVRAIEELPGRTMSGRSFQAAVRGETTPPRDALFFQSNGNESYGNQRVIVTERWKLVVNYFDFDELYDREADPGEQHNLLHRDRPDRTLGLQDVTRVPVAYHHVVADLYRQLWTFALAHDDDLTCNYIMTALGTYGPAIGKTPG